MAILIPELSEIQLNGLPSQAEAKLYRAFRDKLSDEYVVFFEVGWILRREEEHAKDGETDFVICHPSYGYVCVEVKGGGIEHDSQTGQWFSIDRYRKRHTINNPINQALKAKYSIRSKLEEHQRPQEPSLARILKGHSVFFPDVGDTKLLSRPDMPSVLIGGSKDLHNPQEWVDEVFSYWGNNISGFTPMKQSGIEIFRKIFARSFEVNAMVSSQLADQEARRLTLTADQMKILDFLRSHRRVAVSGGAGTGKTLLALEKARRLASEGFRTLLTCYNRQLADHLVSISVGTENLEVMSFHQLCYRQVDRAFRASGRDLVNEAKVTYPGKDLFEVQLPNALGYSSEIISDRYGAIVCDEAQDFREDFWVPLELLLEDFDSSPLYVFYDDNQSLYNRAGAFPICEQPYPLISNCRNTAPIHKAAYRYYKGEPVSPPDIEGEDVQFIESPNLNAQATKINALIVDLVDKQDVEPGDIVVLIADAQRKKDYYSHLKCLPIPKPAVWLEEGYRSKNTVLIDTVQRFKGLESSVVILWGLDNIDLTQRQELLYVGTSRAKSLLVIAGRKETCDVFKKEDEV